ncbi:uncharacterized protein METZ01_LOCUS58676 [marine metagenome]|uniref:Uncharacterized protein n=1 Tax=marine metagenome TaxID=408172 RepID=A0A381SP74_9ZZZZ
MMHHNQITFYSSILTDVLLGFNSG